MYFLGARGGGLLILVVFATIATSGLIIGAEADSRAEIEDAFAEDPEVDMDKHQSPYPEIVPEKYTEPLDLGLFPESEWYDRQVKAFTERLLEAAYTVGHQSALFGYAHRSVFGLSIVQSLLQELMSLGVLGVIGYQLYRIKRIAWGAV